MIATFHKYILNFKNPAGTSRGVLTAKESYFIMIRNGNQVGIGECGLLKGLSVDPLHDYEEKLSWVCNNIENSLSHLMEEVKEYPSICIGLEMAFLSLNSEDPFQIFPSLFSIGNAEIEINGLVWMGNYDFMKNQILDKMNSGYSCIKLKIGAIDFSQEIKLLNLIREEFSQSDIEIRVDANGAFKVGEALEKLKVLSDFKLHSIEQPIAQGQYEEMALLCEKSPLAIALDEELIGVLELSEKDKLLKMIKPQYIILKPSLLGGFDACDEWIQVANKQKIQYWVTSALESNVGLNAISQYTFTKNLKLPQGLGTGSLYTNNFHSPLTIKKGKLRYNPKESWTIPDFMNENNV